jgi:hypothetical protein
MTVYDLWFPILVSGLVTHILSTLAWMIMPHHKPEWQKLPIEDELHTLLTKNKAAAGQFIFPFARNPQEERAADYQDKVRQCRGMLILWATPANMGKAIGLTLLGFFVIAFVIGYLASLAMSRDADFMRVLQFVTTAGLLAHVAANFPHVFWFRRKIAMEVLDGVIYALATGLIFAALWPR